MPAETKQTDAMAVQQKYARLAGFLFLFVLALAFAAGSLASRIEGAGAFEETASRIVASQHLYRAALSVVVIVSLGSAVLAFALYATLKAANTLLAQLALIFSLADAFLALVVRMCGFVTVHLYTSAQAAGSSVVSLKALVDLMRSTASVTENIGGICFGVGTLLFFYLFFKSRYIPRALSVLGIVAASIWACLYFANLIFPERHSLFMLICFPSMALADILTGFYLLLFGIRRALVGQAAGLAMQTDL